MFIDDDEMRQIFKDVSEERLQKLDEGLLLLEKNASDEGKFNDLLREAHSLKGDAIRKLVHEAVTGEASKIDPCSNPCVNICSWVFYPYICNRSFWQRRGVRCSSYKRRAS
ncbi:MAG: Hpt domain-containing protein [Crinalium sp.]